MKRSAHLATALLTLGLALATAGCSTYRRPVAANRAPVYALVVSVNGGQPPTDAQFAALQQRFAPVLAARGLTLVSDAALADQLIHVQFFPDVDDPTLGAAYVVGVRPNPGMQITSPVSTRSAGYSYSYTSFPGYGYGYNYGYGPGYGYNDVYSDYYGYYPSTGGAIVTPPKTTPPDHRRGDRPGDHPPGDDHQPGTDPNRHPPGNYAGTPPPHRDPGDHFRPSPPPRQNPDPDHPRPGYIYPRSEPGYASSSGNSGSSSYSSNNSYSSSSYSGPTTSYSSSAASSAPSISMSSSSSSSSYSAPSYSSSSDSSSSSSQSSSSGGGSVGSASAQEQPR